MKKWELLWKKKFYILDMKIFNSWYGQGTEPLL